MASAKQQGMAMVEIVLVIVIISIAMVASLNAFSVLSGRSSDALMQVKTLDLAQVYVDEALSYAFDEDTGPGGIPTYQSGCRITDDGETRSNYDDVDDLDEIEDETPAMNDASMAGDYSQYRVSIEVVCDDSIGVNSQGAKRVDVSITDPHGKTSFFSVYKGNY